MPLLNYTTQIRSDKTVAEVHKLLAKGGARAIQTEYDDLQRPTTIAFSVETPYGLRFFQLPVNAGRVLAVLKRDPKVAGYLRTLDQAERIAWRIVKDWLAAQLAIIDTEMVSLDQVMLPYMRNSDGKTTYEMYREQQLALPAGSGT